MTEERGCRTKEEGCTGKLSKEKLICPWAVGQNTLSALFSTSFLPLRNDDTLLQAYINL